MNIALSPKNSPINIEKPFHRLYFGFIQFFLGFAAVIGLLLLFPNVLAVAYQLIIDEGLTGSLVRTALLCFAVAFYLNLREMILSYKMTSDLIDIEKGETKSRDEEEGHSSSLMLLIEEFRSFQAGRKLEGDPAKDYVEILMAKSNGVNKILNFLASIMPMLGLLGTVLGLLTSITGLTDFGSNQADILSGVQVILGGMGTSFYSTIAGLVLMITLKYLNLISNHMRQVIFSDIYKFLRYKI